MSSRYRIPCILLFFTVLILGYENYETWSSFSAITPKPESGKKVESTPDLPPPALAPEEPAPRESFNAIAEKNIFNPERKEFPIAEAAATEAEPKPITRPMIDLYGVVIGEDYKAASVINPGRPLRKGERETKTIKIGDMIGDYKLTKITPDRIVMKAGEDSFEVLLYVPRARKTPPPASEPTLLRAGSLAPLPRPPVDTPPPATPTVPSAATPPSAAAPELPAPAPQGTL